MAELTTEWKILADWADSTHRIYLEARYRASSVSGNTCTVRYRLRVNVNTSQNATSVNNRWSLGGTGASNASQSGGAFSLNGGDNIISEIEATNISGGSTIAIAGGYYMGYHNWGKTDMYGEATVPTFAVAPTITTLVLESYTDTSATITIGGDYGSPSNADGRWVEVGVAGQNGWVSPSLRSANATNVSQATITVDNNSDKTATLTIAPNTQYWYGGYMWNSVLSSKEIGGSFVTKASAATISVDQVTDNSVTIRYDISADGGYYTKLLKYSIDGGEAWTEGATVASGAATTGTFTISGLSSGTTYTLQSYVTTNAGSMDNQSVQFTTEKDARLYGSAGGGSKEIRTLYGSVGGTAAEIYRLYGSEKGASKLVYSKDITPTKIYGTVYYKSTPDAREVQSVRIRSIAEFNSLCQNSLSWTATFGRGLVTVSNNSTNAIVGIEIGTEITSIGDFFLRGCEYLVQPLTIPTSVTSIGRAFLGRCTSFNQPLVIPNSVTTIGDQFLIRCTSFNQPLTIPNTVTSLTEMFLVDCQSMTSYVDVGDLAPTILKADAYSFATSNASADCHTVGIPIKGNNRSAWLARFPGVDSGTYRRKLLDYGS